MKSKFRVFYPKVSAIIVGQECFPMEVLLAESHGQQKSNGSYHFTLVTKGTADGDSLLTVLKSI